MPTTINLTVGQILTSIEQNIDELTVNGTPSGDLIITASGRQTLNGSGGVDTLIGGADDDIFNGSEDDNIIYGGLGQDTLTGGDGFDSFYFNDLSDSTNSNPDTITDFVQGEDVIALFEFDIDFSDLNITNNGTDTTVSIQSSDSFNFELELNGVHALTQDDFIL